LKSNLDRNLLSGRLAGYNGTVNEALIASLFVSAPDFLVAVPFLHGFLGGLLVGTGFASKMGLASRPAIAAMIMAENNYRLIIWVAVGALILGMLIVILPALLQDRCAQNVQSLRQ